jgi:hypothetical protein
MMRTTTLLAACFGISCGGSSRPPERLSVKEHLDEAARHDSVAEQHQNSYDGSRRAEGGPIECYDQPLAPAPRSGAEEIRIVKPCWTREHSPSEFHREIAAKNRREAAEHRAAAAALVAAEREACEGIGESELSHSPFSHVEDIAAVEAYREDGALRGARIAFRQVPGLSATWLSRALYCHQTRAAVMGFSPTFMPDCPAMLPEVGVSVEATGGSIVVTLRSDRDDIAALIWGRAGDLVARDNE